MSSWFVVEAVLQASGNELRPYWFVFLAYAAAWVLIGGWILTLSRRLRHLENRAGGGGS